MAAQEEVPMVGQAELLVHPKLMESHFQPARLQLLPAAVALLVGAPTNLPCQPLVPAAARLLLEVLRILRDPQLVPAAAPPLPRLRALGVHHPCPEDAGLMVTDAKHWACESRCVCASRYVFVSRHAFASRYVSASRCVSASHYGGEAHYVYANLYEIGSSFFWKGSVCAFWKGSAFAFVRGCAYGAGSVFFEMGSAFEKGSVSEKGFAFEKGSSPAGRFAAPTPSGLAQAPSWQPLHVHSREAPAAQVVPPELVLLVPLELLLPRPSATMPALLPALLHPFVQQAASLVQKRRLVALMACRHPSAGQP